MDQSPAEQEIFATWLASKENNPAVYVTAHTHPPDRLYRIDGSDWRAGIIAYCDDGTVTVAVSGKYNLIPYEFVVEHVDPSTLFECELPGDDVQVGVIHGRVGDAVAQIEGEQISPSKPSERGWERGFKAYRVLGTVRAVRWWLNGDHPDDACETYVNDDGLIGKTEGKIVRRFRHPEVPGSRICESCGVYMGDHGWIEGRSCCSVDGYVVCPGDWLVDSGHSHVVVCDDAGFRANYEVPEEGS